MRKLIVMCLLFYVTSICWGQDYFEWRVAHERWIGKDKVIHITGSYLMCAGFHSQCKLRHAMLFTSLIGLAWEIKDAWVPYEKVGDFGGQGFSYSDYMIGNVGILLYAGSSYLYSKIRSKNKNNKMKLPKELRITFVELKN